MNKQANPFLTMREAIYTLECIGVNPLGLTTGATNSWYEEIISVEVEKKYDAKGNFFRIKVHVTPMGMKRFAETQPTSFVGECFARVTFTERPGETHDKIYTSFDDLLEVFCLVRKDEEFII